MTPGTEVRVLTGMNGGRVGVVVNTYRAASGQTVVNVRLVTPVLITRPDGPTEEVVLPYGPVELEVLDDLIEPDPARTCSQCGTSWTAEVDDCPNGPHGCVGPCNHQDSGECATRPLALQRQSPWTGDVSESRSSTGESVATGTPMHATGVNDGQGTYLSLPDGADDAPDESKGVADSTLASRPAPVAQPLDGIRPAFPTCEGPNRETVDMVCQTCGFDYGGES